jgi:phage tail sheath protein FI
MGQMKTPGVYIVEKNAFPNSVVEVATAVPAFIGYTEFADNKGKTLLNRPWRISSLAEFHQYYGFAPKAKFVIGARPDPKAVALAKAKAAVAATARSEGVATAEQALADAVSKQAEKAQALAQAEVDLDADQTKQVARDTAQSDSKKAAAAVTDAKAKLAVAKTKAETTAAEARNAQAVADAKAAATAAKAKALAVATQEKALAVAAKTLADKVLALAEADAALATKPGDSALIAKQKAATDAKQTAESGVDDAQLALNAAKNPPPADADADAPDGPTAFKLGEREYLLTQPDGAAGGRFLLYAGMRQFFQNGGGPCYIVSVGDYSADAVEADALTGGIDTLIKEQEPTMVVIPDAMLLSESDCISVQQQILMHCGDKMRSRVAILDIWGGWKDIKDEPNCIAEFRNHLGINYLDFAAAYYPWVHTTVVQDNELNYTNIANPEVLQAVLRTELKLGKDEPPKSAPLKQQAMWVAVDDIGKTEAHWKDVVTARAQTEGKTCTPEELTQGARMQVHLLNKSLSALSPTFNTLMGEIRNRLNLLPPSAAMAGVYTMVDNSRGVWKAPANVSINGVTAPAVNLSAADQEDLNVTTQGKSINAIRSFIGEGVLVWGARTLDGNSLDWRYISVRRTMIMLEESCRLAAKAMVFEPNVANTWVTIKSMIQNFLTGIWKRGGLAGAVPDDAFSVHVGLGETMTPEDVLEGILRVSVLVAISRPAEFIEITFQQQMQKS